MKLTPTEAKKSPSIVYMDAAKFSQGADSLLHPLLARTPYAVDTVELALTDSFIVDRLVSRLRRLATPRRYRDKDGNIQKRRFGFKQQLYFEVEGRGFYLAFNPWHSSYPTLLIQFHLSQFPTFKEALKWLESIFQDDFGQIWTAELKRLDICADVELPFSTVRQMLTQPRGRIVSQYKSGRGQTFYLGKQPKQTCVYEKKIATPQGDVHVTRIEVRLTKSKLPIKRFSQITRINVRNPLDHLTVVSIDEALINQVSDSKLQHIKAYLYDREQHGAQVAKRMHNKNRNFSKTIGKYLGTAQLDLHQIWLTSFDAYFGAVTAISAKEVA